MVLYALHDAMVKPMPGNTLAPSLAEVVVDLRGRADLRVRAARGRQVPQRRPGHRRGRQVLVRALPRHLARAAEGAGRGDRDRRSAPCALQAGQAVARFPDLLFDDTGAGWIVPKKYIEKVGEEGFKKAPIGAGPYKFVSFNPGVELVLEAFDGYWRKTAVGEAAGVPGDPGRGDAAGGAEERRNRHRLLDPRRTRRGTGAHAGSDAQAGGRAGRRSGSISPSSGTRNRRGTTSRVRQAANLAIDREGMQQGADPRSLAGHRQHDRPEAYEFYWQPPEPVYDPRRRRNCWPRRAIPNGFDAGAF